MSRKTVIPINYVPFIMFYVKGIPYIQYTGEYSTDDICDFIKSISLKLKDRAVTIQRQQQEEKKMKTCTLSIPMKGSKKKIDQNAILLIFLLTSNFN